MDPNPNKLIELKKKMRDRGRGIKNERVCKRKEIKKQKKRGGKKYDKKGCEYFPSPPEKKNIKQVISQIIDLMPFPSLVSYLEV